MPINLSEEKEYLQGLEEELRKTADKLLKSMEHYSASSREFMRYFWEHQWEFDVYETIFQKLTLNRLTDTGESTKKQFQRILNMMDSPYFSRIDFQPPEDPEVMKIYIGKYSFWDAKSAYQVFDWRAPIASMYYEFEPGDAWYDAPSGRISGNLSRKRQYKIKKGVLEYALESGLAITDELLQQELSRESDGRMKDIVTTIQKEQNRLIREENAHTLIIQGAAGSGKTSIALHRIAYYLYRFQNELTAKNFLIVSPNGIFMDYISAVLPELGEESVRSVSMEEVAILLLPFGLRAEPASVSMNRFLESADDAWAERNSWKSSPELVRLLEEYFAYCNGHYFNFPDYEYRGGVIDREFIRKCLARQTALPVRQRLRDTAGMIAGEIRSRLGEGKYCPPKNEILDWLTVRFRFPEPLELYRNFYVWLGREDLFPWREGQPLESTDLFPLVYVRLYLEGGAGDPAVRHLIIDEMQDYSPIQYAVLNKLYPCRKTILGDFFQNVTPFAQNSLDDLKELYPEAKITVVTKSYRSTLEIMEFAGRIRPEVLLEPVSRHGEAPDVIACRDAEQERGTVLELAQKALAENSGGRLGILCKSQDQAALLYLWLKRRITDNGLLHLLSDDSAEFYGGVIVCPVVLSKGLEFDEVIIPGADCKNYRSEYERSLLYVACTRAMHRLTLLYSGEPSLLLPRTER
ncbi:MAG: AAA family ATPase [Roseburia sp.]|nr:AAA family ATPase [Roseburia sp.]MCM1099547.1 AAA family ATPase [Ruminococcus flavefaciens]